MKICQDNGYFNLICLSIRNKSFFQGGILSDVEISNNEMVNFLDLNKDMFKIITNAHLKIINIQSLKLSNKNMYPHE